MLGFVEWAEQNPENCSVKRALEVVGQPWLLLVLREVSRGLHRYADIRRHLQISDPVLTRRLEAMVESGLIERRPYRDPGRRARHEYHLTEKGRELSLILGALKGWGDRYLADPEGPATLYRHLDCGAPVRVTFSCEHGHQFDSGQELEVAPGPGAKPLSV
jgi:DNA-binding HxlR family transcriptional regulator